MMKVINMFNKFVERERKKVGQTFYEETEVRTINFLDSNLNTLIVITKLIQYKIEVARSLRGSK